MGIPNSRIGYNLALGYQIVISNQVLATPKRKAPEDRTDELESWIRAVVHQMRAAARNGAYGVLRIEFRDGHIRRAILERSVNRPEVLEQLDELDDG